MYPELDGSPDLLPPFVLEWSLWEQMARVHNMQDAFPVTELIASKHWRNLKLLIPPASSFPHLREGASVPL